MSNSRATSIHARREALFSHGPSHLRAEGYGADDFQRVAVPARDCDVLHDLLLAASPSTVIEIGLAYGASALAIAEALVASGVDETRHLIVDAHHEGFSPRRLASLGASRADRRVRPRRRTLANRPASPLG